MRTPFSFWSQFAHIYCTPHTQSSLSLLHVYSPQTCYQGKFLKNLQDSFLTHFTHSQTFLLQLISFKHLRLPLWSMIVSRHLFRAHSCLTGMLLQVIEGSQLMGMYLYSVGWLSKTFNLHSINEE